ncbi:hypothetical protein AYL99_11606 [Fonsecaea erecta]|uniref:Uncharacterized protein n=1 Tax=Fonsecaea erecta TaxID=1367422 RepID=A0A178Z2S2_9EURO|nr:hypothetical protein AYL99_11606 [Fonsecaea erecta]OAP54072.1 hypothetical protein AYL99_11606 [Fonsecaea erecta]
MLSNWKECEDGGDISPEKQTESGYDSGYVSQVMSRSSSTDQFSSALAVPRLPLVWARVSEHLHLITVWIVTVYPCVLVDNSLLMTTNASVNMNPPLLITLLLLVAFLLALFRNRTAALGLCMVTDSRQQTFIDMPMVLARAAQPYRPQHGRRRAHVHLQPINVSMTTNGEPPAYATIPRPRQATSIPTSVTTSTPESYIHILTDELCGTSCDNHACTAMPRHIAAYSPMTMKIALSTIVSKIVTDMNNVRKLDLESTIVCCNGKAIVCVFDSIGSRMGMGDASNRVTTIDGIISIMKAWNKNRQILCFATTRSPTDIDSNMTLFDNCTMDIIGPRRRTPPARAPSPPS